MARGDPRRGVSLRVRLLAGLMFLMTVGLAAAAAASVLVLRAYLLDRADARLRGAQDLVATRVLGFLPRAAPALGVAVLDRTVGPTDYIVEIRPPGGPVLAVAGGGSDPPRSGPLMDRVSDLGSRAAAGAPFTVDDGGERFRAIAGTLPAGGGTDLVALPMRPATATVHRLAVIEAMAGAVVLVTAGISAWLILGRGLRPLRDVAETAAAIAAGDLSRRVPNSPVRSETGRLAAALNVMLGQIQTAFDERGRSQERLRLFVADASHELRTPLTSVRGYIDLLRQGAVPPPGVDDALRRVQEETRRMSTLVDDMLYLAHLDEQPPLDRAEVDLAIIVRDAVADTSAVEPDRDVALDCPPTCVVVGDGDALRQVVGNLLTNVRVHTPTSAAAAVTVARVGDRVCLRVSDTGPGMPPGAVDRVFDRFYRASGGRDRVHGGSGLGMSIVAAVAAVHGGTAEVHSTVGVGTTVTVTLPLDPARAGARTEPAHSPPA